jgi:hypothetical protein
LRQAEGRLKKHIATRSCHFITIELNFFAVMAEYAGQNKYLKNLKQPAPQPHRISAAFLQEMDDKLRPLL